MTINNITTTTTTTGDNTMQTTIHGFTKVPTIADIVERAIKPDWDLLDSMPRQSSTRAQIILNSTYAPEGHEIRETMWFNTYVDNDCTHGLLVFYVNHSLVYFYAKVGDVADHEADVLSCCLRQAGFEFSGDVVVYDALVDITKALFNTEYVYMSCFRV